ncbi:MAG: sulfatase-like hydrolase/transferase, partial [Infirmifilum sp.]
VKYENVYAPAPWTLPSHVSMFTGMYPSEHGVHETKDSNALNLVTPSRIKMVKSEGGILGVLKASNYTTYIISANSFITSTYGFYSDEQYFIDPLTERIFDSKALKLDIMMTIYQSRTKILQKLLKESQYKEIAEGIKLYFKRRLSRVYMLPKYISEKYVMKKGGSAIKKLIAYLKLDEPYFLFINIFVAHPPYTKNDLREKRLLSYVNQWLVTGEIDPNALKLWKNYPLHAKEATKIALELVHQIKRKGNWDNTLIIITSDHGELLGDGGLHHVYSLLDGNLRVPLYVKYTGKPKKQKGYLSLIDIPRLIDPNSEEIGRRIIFAETYGIHYSPTGKWSSYINDKHYHHKIRVITTKYDFIYNNTEKRIEKIFKGDLQNLKSDLTKIL